jgi:hypothetical protein
MPPIPSLAVCHVLFRRRFEPFSKWDKHRNARGSDEQITAEKGRTQKYRAAVRMRDVQVRGVPASITETMATY